MRVWFWRPQENTGVVRLWAAIWVLGTELQPSARAVGVLNHSAVSPARSLAGLNGYPRVVVLSFALFHVGD